MAVHENWWRAMIGKLLGCFIIGADPDPPSAFLINPPLYEDLLPGLPNSLVLDCILPRIPWYARPLLNATSRAWSHALDALSAPDRHHVRTVYNNNNNNNNDDDRDRGIECNLLKVSGSRNAISLYDTGQGLWRNLPPLPCEKALRPCSCYPPTPLDSLPATPIVVGFMCTTKNYNNIRVDYVCGKVIAAHMYDVPGDIHMCGACVWTLDVQGGMWKWEERHNYTKRGLPYPIVANMVVAAGKLYILRQGMCEWKKPVIYDVASDEWGGETPDGDYMYTTRTVSDPDTGKLSKVLYALGDYRTVKILDPLTGTWKDFHKRQA